MNTVISRVVQNRRCSYILSCVIFINPIHKSLVLLFLLLLISHTLHGTWRKEETRVDTKGKCAFCGLRLQPLPTLSSVEFVELRDAFMELSIKRNGNVFLHTTPEELEAYQKFLSHYSVKPFDVVIDGLNIAHATRQDATKQEKDDVV